MIRISVETPPVPHVPNIVVETSSRDISEQNQNQPSPTRYLKSLSFDFLLNAYEVAISTKEPYQPLIDILWKQLTAHVHAHPECQSWMPAEKAIVKEPCPCTIL